MTEIIRKNPDETAQWMMSREQSTLLQEGEKMKNESVKHVRYGTGRVAEVVQNHKVVLFDGEAGRKAVSYTHLPTAVSCWSSHPSTEALCASLWDRPRKQAYLLFPMTGF